MASEAGMSIVVAHEYKPYGDFNSMEIAPPDALDLISMAEL